MIKNTCVESLPALLDRSATARAVSDWNRLEEISIQILRLIYRESKVDEATLRSTVQNYLSSIVGTGDFLTDFNSQDSSRYQEGLAKLQIFLKNRHHQFSSVESTLQAAYEISLLSLDPVPANRNKIGRHLREIARPDLSIIICNQILEQTRLNYYALTVLCGAHCDLGQFEKAIEVAQFALKFNPEQSKSYPLNALVRAHTLKFKATGDFSEIEKALEYGHESIEIRIDSYAANAFVAAAVASGDEGEIGFAKEFLSKAEPQLKEADISAIFQAYQAAQMLAPKEVVVETIDEFTDSTSFGFSESLFDLVLRDEGFIPQADDLRNMNARFSADGWFLQGTSVVPCPMCEIVALHSYRKHFKRYGKEMHYWALVCDNCKTATDSIDYEKKAFGLISKDLEENFPISLVCPECK
jgi:tetratricopeptide (TPR) repeat protein